MNLPALAVALGLYELRDPDALAASARRPRPVKVVVVNAYSMNRDRPALVQWLAGLDADIYLLSEAHGLDLDRLGTDHGSPRGGKGRRECRVVTGPRFTTHEARLVLLSPDMNAELDAAHADARWACVVRGEVGGWRISPIAYHGNPKGKGAPVWRRKGLRRLRRIVKAERKAGHDPIPGGDANDRGRDGYTGRWHERQGLHFRTTELMWVASGRPFADYRTVPAERVPGLGKGQHPVQVALLTPPAQAARPKRRRRRGRGIRVERAREALAGAKGSGRRARLIRAARERLRAIRPVGARQR